LEKIIACYKHETGTHVSFDVGGDT
jgi:hypothetical protein